MALRHGRAVFGVTEHAMETAELRGGSFFYLGRSVRSAFRDYYRPIAGIMYVGLRPARTMPKK